MKTVPPSGKATVDALADHWGKLLATYMHREQIKEIIITAADLAAIADDPASPTILVQELEDGLHVHVMPVQDAMAMARRNKGGFGKS